MRFKTMHKKIATHTSTLFKLEQSKLCRGFWFRRETKYDLNAWETTHWLLGKKKSHTLSIT